MSLLTEDEKFTSLLDVVLQEYNEDKQKRASRLFLTGTFDASRHSETEIETFFHTFIAENQVTLKEGEALRDNPDSITGVVMVINNSAVSVVLESPVDILRQLIKTFVSLEQQQTNFLTHVKVCAFVEEVPREYPIFAYRVTKATIDDFSGSPVMSKVVFDAYRNLVELGRETGAMTDAKAAEYLEKSLARQFLQHIPTAEKIAVFQTCEEIPSCADWVSIFEAPVDLDFDSELTWPAHDHVQL